LLPIGGGTIGLFMGEPDFGASLVLVITVPATALMAGLIFFVMKGMMMS